jgi:hypothetical protein
MWKLYKDKTGTLKITRFQKLWNLGYFNQCLIYRSSRVVYPIYSGLTM